MGINPQQQQQSNNNSSINYQITTINPPTTTTTLNGGNIGSTIITTGSGGGGGGNIIGTITNLVNMNLTSVSVSAATPSTITTTTTASTTITNNPNTITTIATNNNNNALSLCCLIENGTKCTRNAGNASYSKRIEKQVAQRKLQLIVDPRSSHAYICEHHKQIIQSIRTNSKRKRKDVNLIGNDDGIGMIDDELSMNDFNGLMNDSSNEMIQHSIVPSIMNVNSSIHHHHHSHHHMNNSGKYGLQHHQQQQQQPSSYTSTTTTSSPIDFHSLQVNTLRKYKRHFRLPIKHASNKNQLADEIQRHFRSLDVNEKDVINKFMYMVKNGGNNNNNNNSNNGNNGKSNEFNNSKE